MMAGWKKFRLGDDRPTVWLTIVTVVLNAAAWIIVARFGPQAEASSPLHYTIYFGINLTGHWTTLFWLPGLGAIALLSHLLISALRPHLVWKRLWLLLALVMNALAITDAVAVLHLIRTAVD